MKIKIDKTCVGCGTCVALVPEVFEMNDVLASVKDVDDKKLEKLKDKIKQAEEACPAGAIKVS